MLRTTSFAPTESRAEAAGNAGIPVGIDLGVGGGAWFVPAGGACPNKLALAANINNNIPNLNFICFCLELLPV